MTDTRKAGQRSNAVGRHESKRWVWLRWKHPKAGRYWIMCWIYGAKAAGEAQE